MIRTFRKRFKWAPASNSGRTEGIPRNKLIRRGRHSDPNITRTAVLRPGKRTSISAGFWIACKQTNKQTHKQSNYLHRAESFLRS
jgi:hypothetical protein